LKNKGFEKKPTPTVTTSSNLVPMTFPIHLLCLLGMFQQEQSRTSDLLTRARIANAPHAKHIASSGSYVIIIIHGES